MEYCVEAGVRRCIAAREAGLTTVPIEIHVPGQAPLLTTLPLDVLLSPKSRIEPDARFRCIRPPILVPVAVQPAGLPGQPAVIPLRDVVLGFDPDDEP